MSGSGKKKSNKSRRERAINPSAAVTQYSGPVHLGPRTGENQRLYTTMLRYYVTLSSDGAGANANVYGNSPSSASDWANFQGSYDEYRTLAMEVKFIPWNIYNKATATVMQASISVVDNDSAGALASYSSAAAYESAELRSMEKPFSVIWKMSGQPQSVFTTTASPASSAWIKFFGNTYTASYALGAVMIEYLVQFRGQN